MRTYRVTIDTVASYEDGNTDIWEGVRSLRNKNPATLSPLFRELNRECLITCFAPAVDRTSTAFDVIVFGRPFSDNTEYVRQMVVRARDIWGLGLADDLAPHLHVQEIRAQELFEGGWGSSDGIPREMLLQANLFELRRMLQGNFMRSIPMHDYICTLDISRRRALELAAEGRYSRSLVRELGNVYRGPRGTDGELGSNTDAPRRIPVHYLLEGAGTPHYESALDLVVNALDAVDRLPSRHVYHLRFAENEDISSRDLDFESLVNERFACALEGNVLVIEYGESDSDGRFNSGLYQKFSRTLLLLNDHLDAIQLFILVPPATMRSNSVCAINCESHSRTSTSTGTPRAGATPRHTRNCAPWPTKRMSRWTIASPPSSLVTEPKKRAIPCSRSSMNGSPSDERP